MKTMTALAPVHARPREKERGASGRFGARRTARRTITERKLIEVARCAMDTAGGKRRSTVAAPRLACKRTRAKAMSASLLAPFSARLVAAKSANVSAATASAISRCVCSNSTPPVIDGKAVP
jgi:hypothetical protein